MSICKEVQGITIECLQGDIASQEDIEGVVNAANSQLKRGGGVAGAIHRAAGIGLEEECRPLSPIKTGEAVMTKGHKLPNDYVIHALGPVYGEERDPEARLRETYRNVLDLAHREGLVSIAFPAISTGAFGYPLEEGALVAMEEVKKRLHVLTSLKRIRFVLYGERSYQAFKEALEKVF